MALCGLDTDKNFAVLKGQHVSRPRCPRNFRCKSAIRRSEISQTKTSRNLRKSVCFRFCNCKQRLHGVASELFELGNIDWDFSLTNYAR